MAWLSASVMSELTQQSGSLTHVASDLGWACQKVCLYGIFVSGLHHLPPWMKNQHELNEEKKIVSQLSTCDVTRVVSLDTNNLSVRVGESGELSDYFRLHINYGYLLSRFSSNGFTLWIFILSILFPHWTVIIAFVWTDIMSQGLVCHLDFAWRRIPSFLNSIFWTTL